MSKYGIFSAPNAGKYGLEKTPYLDTFHVMRVISIEKNLCFGRPFNMKISLVVTLMFRFYTICKRQKNRFSGSIEIGYFRKTA